MRTSLVFLVALVVLVVASAVASGGVAFAPAGGTGTGTGTGAGAGVRGRGRGRGRRRLLSSPLAGGGTGGRRGAGRALFVAGGGGSLAIGGDGTGTAVSKVVTPSPPMAQQAGSGMGMGSSIFNLVKNVVGSGVLALPGGIAVFTQSKAAAAPVLLLTAILGLISAYCFRMSAEFDSHTLGEAWGRTISEDTKWLPDASIAAKTIFTCLTYSIIIGDIYGNLATTFGVTGWLAPRSTGLALISATVLFPLCMLRDLSALSFTSVAGVLGTVFTAGVMIRRWFDRSYAVGGAFFDAAAAGTFGGSVSFGPLSLILVSMLSTGFIAHYNAPRFYHQLRNKSVPRFNLVVGVSYAAAIALYGAMMVVPFFTFGGACQSFILNNYATGDGLATLARLAISVSIIFGYPLTFLVAREGVLGAMQAKKPTKKQSTMVTVGLLTAFTAVATVLRDLGFVVAFGGAVLGSSIIYIFPALMWVSKCRRDVKAGKAMKAAQRLEYYASYGLIGVGSALGIVGGIVSVLKAFVW